MKNPVFFAAFAALLCGPSFAMAAPSKHSECPASVPEMTPGGIPKKYVGLLFDVFNTTPSNILANADQFATHTPYLDGVAIGLQNVPVITGDGNVATSKFHLIMHPTERWTRDAVKDQLPYLKEIAKKPHLTESMLLFWMSPGGRGNRIDWDNDKGWANYAENMATVAWLAKEAGLKGLMLDPEEYGAQGGQLAQHIHSHEDPPFPECAKIARQRGREVFSRVFKEFPDAVIWSLWCFKKFGFWFDGGRQPFTVENVDQSGELLHYFLNGMLDVLPPTARVVDGAEHYSGSALNNAYIEDFVMMATTALALVAPENLVKYRSQVYYGNTHYLDMYTMSGNPKSLWYHGPVDGSRLEHMRLNFEQSLKVATGYVWLYGENSGKLFNWRDGHYSKQKTWEEVSPGMTETIMLVKNPLGLAAERKAALAKEGKLVNLAKDFKGIKIAPTSEEREFHASEAKMYSAKGLKPGNRYRVVLEVIEKGAEKGTYRDGAAIPQAFWRKNGVRTAAKPMPIKLHYDKGRFGRGGVEATLTVVVPEDADELVFDLGATLRLNEHVVYWSLNVFDLLDPVKPVKNDYLGKWNFDPAAKTLTNGRWKLGATLDKKNGTLKVRGDNDKTVGSGVLDFSTVKADTGYSVATLSDLNNIPGMTALIGPDVESVGGGGIVGCSNVTFVALGKINTPGHEKMPDKDRLSRLNNLGCAVKVPIAFRTLDLRHLISSVVRPDEGLSVKGVKPGELYSVGLSMKRHGPGCVYLFARFRGNGEEIKSKERFPAIAMAGQRQDDVWQSGEVVVRIPEGADELYFHIEAFITEDHTSIEIDDFKVYKIGEPLPVWPAESRREKVR